MYPDELKYFIASKNYRLGGEDLLKAISLKENPQLDKIIFDAYSNSYNMWDRYGNNYQFSAIPISEYNKQKTLKK